MSYSKLYVLVGWLVFVFMLGGCATVVPQFAVPTDDRGVPSTDSITRRVICELVSMVRNDLPEDETFIKRYDLLYYDYNVEMLLLLNVTDSGGLAPSLNFPGMKLFFDANFTLSQAREDALSIRISYSMRDLAKAFERRKDRALCPVTDTYLAGDLGLRRSVIGALSTRGLITTTEASPDGGEFSGSVGFTITKNLSGLGPTFMFTNFRGPGSLISASEVQIDKLSFGFASGTKAGGDFEIIAKTPSEGARRAANALNRQITTDINTQLIAIRNVLR